MNQTSHNQECQFKNVKFVRGITGDDSILAEDRPHIVVAGRSNVGKSSVLNRLFNQKLARVSNTPGKTQEINFYDLNSQAYLVDLPGYGYAKMSGARAEKLRRQMIWYLARSGAPIALLLLVLDIRRGLGELDKDFLDIASGEDLPVVLLANKVDKCNQSERVTAKREIQKQTTDYPDVIEGLIVFSATKGTGQTTLCQLIQSVYGH
jgi:GTP-binding protein